MRVLALDNDLLLNPPFRKHLFKLAPNGASIHSDLRLIPAPVAVSAGTEVVQPLSPLSLSNVQLLTQILGVMFRQVHLPRPNFSYADNFVFSTLTLFLNASASR